MRSYALQLMLVIALIFQGAVAVGGGLPSGHEQQQHCAGHDMNQPEAAQCACCPDGMAAGMSCTAQCSVSQAPLVTFAPVRVAGYSTPLVFAAPALAQADYPPLVPPPIA